MQLFIRFGHFYLSFEFHEKPEKNNSQAQVSFSLSVTGARKNSVRLTSSG